ncbi:PREDICTED: caspase-1-like [Trachymyrmex cornetzi]|uniref:caspase-1-like n=1 Tax=Trachymyrmex cornetzi TaxID=471704 RepID=UPI00084EF7C3|nr:PREDICTED: caspase-1-like [Trachymyrmex cornetzi]
MEPSAIDEAESTDAEVPQTEMNNNIGNTSSNSSNLTLLRRRSNSAVIDSIGLKKYLKVFTYRRRSKSLTSTDYYTQSASHCMDTSCIPGTSRDNHTIRTISDHATNNKREGEQSNKRAKSPLSTIDAIGTIEQKPLINSPSELTALMPVEKDADCYNMNHNNRGKCIIFNHEDFSLSTQMKREGSAKDAERLQKTFGDLGFDVELHNDFKFSEIQKVLKRVSQLDHTDNDCLCVITLTHGVKKDIICANDVMYESNELWKPFAADKCLTLAGKPKLFFIQACRGDESDDGIQLIAPRSLKGTETDSAYTSYSIPIHADFLLAHSSIEGFYTWRSPYEGTWYIQSLCDILDEHGTTMDLMKMLTLTARKVATEFSSSNPEYRTLHNKRQVPSVTTMLIRSVYFPPKLKK